MADHAPGRLSVIRGRSEEVVSLEEPVPTVRETLRAFTRVVRGEIPNPIPPSEGARAVAIAHACLRSAASGEAEAVERII